MHQFKETPSLGRSLFARHPALPQSKLDVLLHIEPGEEGRFLKQEDALCTGLTHPASVNPDFAAAGCFQSSDDTKERGLATSTRSKQANEFARCHVQIYWTQSLDGLIAPSEDFTHVENLQWRPTGKYLWLGALRELMRQRHTSSFLTIVWAYLLNAFY
jgi:hypothetical protein